MSIPTRILTVERIIDSFSIIIFIGIKQHGIQTVYTKLTLPIDIHLEVKGAILPVKFAVTRHFRIFSSRYFLTSYRQSVFPGSDRCHTIFISFCVILPVRSKIVISYTDRSS